MNINFKGNAKGFTNLTRANAFIAAEAGIAAIVFGGVIMKVLRARQKSNDISRESEIEEIYYKLDELEKFRLTMANINKARRAVYLKRELTEEEIEKIERRIYFNKESMQDILAEMDLLK